VLDVSVEDPSEDFQALRDATDARMLFDEGALLPLAAPVCGECECVESVCESVWRECVRVCGERV